MTLRHNKGTRASTALNILGMAAAFAAMYIILVQVNYSVSFNKPLKDADRIYCVAVGNWYDGKYSVWSPRPGMEKVLQDCPGIESGGAAYIGVSNQEWPLVIGEENGPKIKAVCGAVTQSVIPTFGFTLVEGSWDNFASGGKLAVSEGFAADHDLHIGSVVIAPDVLGGKSVVSVIFKEFPQNTDLYGTDIFTNFGDEGIDNWSNWAYPYYVKLAPGAKVEEVEASAARIIDEIFKDSHTDEQDYAMLEMLHPHFVSFLDTYFDKTITNHDLQQGSRSSAMTLLAIAILIILIAVINFINFFFALVPLRVHDVNTRKVLGASRLSLVLNNMRSAALMILCALLLAALAVRVFAGSAMASYIPCSVAFVENGKIVALTIGVAILVSVVASLYPALYITSFEPAMALRGSLSRTFFLARHSSKQAWPLLSSSEKRSFLSSSKGKTFRYVLVGVQFVISIALIIGALFVNLQRGYMMKHDLGFDRENLLYCPCSDKLWTSRESLESRLKQNPAVKDISWADGSLIEMYRMGWSREFKDNTISFQCYPVAWNFPEFIGVKITEGRYFLPGDEQAETGTYLFNEAAHNEFGLTLEDKLEGIQGENPIVGFCADINFQPLQYECTPFCFYVMGKYTWKWNQSTLFVRTEKGADMAAVRHFIHETVTEADPDLDPDEISVRFLDENVEMMYGEERQLSRLITAFALVAILISLMGVFGLVLFETEHRRREIGIRRVNGATIGQILQMFAMRFIWIVLACFAVAAPLSYWAVHRWLTGFAYRTPIRIWVFALALAATLLVTVIVVVLRSLRAATVNPCESLKTEA